MRIPAALDSWGALRGPGRSLLVLVSYALGAPSLCDHAGSHQADTCRVLLLSHGGVDPVLGFPSSDLG